MCCEFETDLSSIYTHLFYSNIIAISNLIQEPNHIVHAYKPPLADCSLLKVIVLLLLHSILCLLVVSSSIPPKD